MSSQVIDGWKPIRGTPGKTIVTQNSDGSYTVTIDPSAIGDGGGDMLKAVYDIDGNGIVDSAESVPWAGVTDKPLVFPPDEHTHSGSDVTSQVSSAASADSVPWAGVTDKPLVFPPDAHTHDDRYYTESEIGALLGGYVLKSTFDANSLLIANTDDTPVALTVGASTLVGRGAAGGIAALSASEGRTVLGLATTDAPTLAGLITDNGNSSEINIRGRTGGNIGTLQLRSPSGAQAIIMQSSPSGAAALIDFAPSPADGTSNAVFRFFRLTNTTGTVQATVHVGDGTSTSNSVIGGNVSTYFGLNYGNLGFATSAPTISDGRGVDINGKILRLRSSKTPSSASDTGNVGEICWDSNYVNVAVGTNTWKKTPLVSAFAANSIIYADTSGNPANLTVGASTLVGRAASGGIAALSASDARTVLGLATTDTPTFAGVVTAYVAPASDGTTAFQVRKADKSTAVLTVDTTNGRIGIGITPEAKIDVALDSSGGRFRRYGGSPSFAFYRADGTIASPTEVTGTGTVGALSAFSYDGSGYANVGIIRFNQLGSTAGGDRRGAITMSVLAVGTVTERFHITSTGVVGLSATTPTISDGVGVDINGKILRLRSSKTPSSASDTGNVGEICWDSGAIYVCVATNTWKKATLATW